MTMVQVNVAAYRQSRRMVLLPESRYSSWTPTMPHLWADENRLLG
jgi:hypothetical protein